MFYMHIYHILVCRSSIYNYSYSLVCTVIEIPVSRPDMVVFSTHTLNFAPVQFSYPAGQFITLHTHTHIEHTHIQFAAASITINPYKFPLYIPSAKRNDSNKNFQMQTKQILINEKLQLQKKQGMRHPLCPLALSLSLLLLLSL